MTEVTRVAISTGGTRRCAGTGRAERIHRYDGGECEHQEERFHAYHSMRFECAMQENFKDGYV